MFEKINKEKSDEFSKFYINNTFTNFFKKLNNEIESSSSNIYDTLNNIQQDNNFNKINENYLQDNKKNLINLELSKSDNFLFNRKQIGRGYEEYDEFGEKIDEEYEKNYKYLEDESDEEDQFSITSDDDKEIKQIVSDSDDDIDKNYLNINSN